MLYVVPRKRNPTTAIAWLLIIFFVPWIGLFLFLIAGTRGLPRRRVERYRLMISEFNQITQEFCSQANIVEPQLDPEAMSAVRLAERLGQFPILGGNRVELITDTDEMVNRLIADIDTAQSHVHMLYYIFAADETGRRVIEALRRASERGAKCRLLVDAVGSRSFLRGLGSELPKMGIEVVPALPVGVFRGKMARIDVRNHRKIVVIDGRIAYTGSQNIINADYGRRGLAWHDLTARVLGPTVLALQSVFLCDWYFETEQTLTDAEIFPRTPPAGNTPIQVLPSGPIYPVENYHRMVLAALHTARRQVIITTPYFVPDESFLQAVQVAVLRGVNVVLIAPAVCDKVLVGAAARSYFGDLLQLGAEVYLYHPGLLHSKTMTIDDSFAFVGTGNFDIRSFSLTFELNLLLYGTEVTETLRVVQRQYLARSTRLTLEEWENRPEWAKTLDGIAKLLSPVL